MGAKSDTPDGAAAKIAKAQPTFRSQPPPAASDVKASTSIALLHSQRQRSTHHDRIPVTTIPRTIEDLEGVASDRTRSDLEALFLELCTRYGVPCPEVNVNLGRWEVDFLRRSHNVVVDD